MGTDTYEMALAYAKMGMHVIPIRVRSKRPFLTNWVEDCSIRQSTLEEWFKNTEYNIGVVTGKVSDIIVIDIDTKNDVDGRKSLAYKEAELESFLPSTVTARTQSGGIHLFFAYPKEVEKITGRVHILEGVDIRADGNQVVVYPSIGDKGKYEWIISPFEQSFAPLPPRWVDFICGTNNGLTVKIPKRPFKLPEHIPSGMRHSVLLSYASSLSAKGANSTEISGAVREANRTLCDPPVEDEGELENIINWAMERKDTPSKGKDANLPSWVDMDSKGRITINEPNFTVWYKDTYGLLCINGIFYNNDGVVDTNGIKQDIQNLIATYVDSSLGTKVNALLEALKNKCFFLPPPPQFDVVNVYNTSLHINEEGLYEVRMPFTLNRLAVSYDAVAEAPMWDKFLHDLLYEEDIYTLQEFIGYCLVPTTIAQKSLFLIGKGGEGKSVVGEVLQGLFGTSMVQGELHKIQENRFMLAQLEHKLLFYDDDLQTSALSDTGIFKKLVTATIPFLVERKGEPHYEMLPYVRVLASGNKGIEACYDHSDGFYRRLIMLHCKEKGRRKDDKLLAKKIISNELSGILNWALIGLQRLIAQEWEFTISERSEGVLRDAEESSNTFIPFIMDNTVVEYGLDKTVTSADLYLAYERWCADNAIKPLATRTVTTYLKENLTYYGIRYSNKIDGNKRGYVGIGLLSPVAKAGRFKIVQGGV